MIRYDDVEEVGFVRQTLALFQISDDISHKKLSYVPYRSHFPLKSPHMDFTNETFLLESR